MRVVGSVFRELLWTRHCLQADKADEEVSDTGKADKSH